MENKEIYEQKQASMKRIGRHASIINLVLSDYSRKSSDETMMIKSFRKSDIETTNRKSHSDNLCNIAKLIAENLDLNVPTVVLMAKYHDIGHTFLGHSGEWWLSEIKKNLGLGFYVHNSLGTRDLIYTNQIETKIKDALYSFYGTNDTSGDIEKVCEDLWIIFDGINSHNGELSESTYIPNIRKTKSNFEEELMLCHIQEGYDRKLIPATTEACLMRLCDKISYIPFDMIDGLREGIIDNLDEEYMNVLVPILTTGNKTSADDAIHFINHCVEKQNYNALAHKLQLIFTNDVIKNSDKEKIAMSNSMSMYMHKLRDINNKKIVNYVLMTEDHDIYPRSLEELAHEFSKIIMKEKLLNRLHSADKDSDLTEQLVEKYKDTPYINFVKFIARTNSEDFEWTQQMLKQARDEAIKTELKEALELAKVDKQVSFTNGQEKRVRRIRCYKDMFSRQISALKENGHSITESDYEQMTRFQQEKFAPKMYMSLEESMAFEFGTKYLASLSDTEFMDLLKMTGKVDNEHFTSLTRKYRNINLQEEYMTHGQWDKLSKEQSSETEKEI